MRPSSRYRIIPTAKTGRTGRRESQPNRHTIAATNTGIVSCGSRIKMADITDGTNTATDVGIRSRGRGSRSPEKPNIDVNVNKNVHVNRNVTVNRNVHVNRNVNVNRNVHSNFVVGRRYNGHYWYGQNRHRWHNTWYAYGVGPCWISIDGLWFWNEAACP